MDNCSFSKSNGQHRPLGGVQFAATGVPAFQEFFENVKQTINIKPPKGGRIDDNLSMLNDYLAREYPSIMSGQQDKVIFMPECYLSNNPNVVDSNEENWIALGAGAEQFSNRKASIDGDKTERLFYDKLKKLFCDDKRVTEKKTVVFHSWSDVYLRQLELDFLIINEEFKMIISILCKTTGSKSNCQKDAQKLCNSYSYFQDKMPIINSWTFVKSFFTREYLEETEVRSSVNLSYTICNQGVSNTRPAG
jgi:hypothetical protein